MTVREKLVKLLESAESSIYWDSSDKGFIQKIADHLLANGVTIQNWIPVTERLPDDNERVIAYRQNEADASAYKYCVMWGWSVRSSFRHAGISHWMPLPEPPKE